MYTQRARVVLIDRMLLSYHVYVNIYMHIYMYVYIFIRTKIHTWIHISTIYTGSLCGVD
jgi:hypothetical protein